MDELGIFPGAIPTLIWLAKTYMYPELTIDHMNIPIKPKLDIFPTQISLSWIYLQLFQQLLHHKKKYEKL